MEVKIDKISSTLIATMKEGATEGNILLLASAGNNTVLKPIYFTYGTAILDEPIYQGHVGPIQLKGTQMNIEMQISANISYQVNTEMSGSPTTGPAHWLQPHTLSPFWPMKQATNVPEK